MSDRKLLVTHHAPDLDACGAVWIFKRFDAQHFANAKVAFVNPGQTISDEELNQLEFEPEEIVHVDTGLGEYDHHQPERGQLQICATSLVYDQVVSIHPELADDKPLNAIVEYITNIDHFNEIYWPESKEPRFAFTVQELIRGLEFLELHDDDSQLHFALTCLDSAYGVLTQHFKAQEIIDEKGQSFSLSFGRCLALETRNDDTLKVAQKQGYMLVVRKDPESGAIRIKARPDAPIDLKPLAEKITKKDAIGSWYYHPSGKMLLNGSSKHKDQMASPLSLQQIIDLINSVYN